MADPRIVKVGLPYLDPKTASKRTPEHIFVVCTGPDPTNVCVIKYHRVQTADLAVANRARQQFIAEHAAMMHPEAVVPAPKAAEGQPS